MNSVISYKGEVTVTIDGKKGTTRKNTGKLLLFKLLCDVLAGAYNDSSKGKDKLYDSIPQYINVYQMINEEVDTSHPINLSPIPILNRVVDVYQKNTSASVTYYATLHTSNTSDTTISGEKIVLELVDDNREVLAQVQHNSQDFIELTSNNLNYSQCTIEWKLTFANDTQDTDSNEKGA